MKNKKGIDSMHFVIGIIMGLLILMLMGPILFELLREPSSATKGCSQTANFISNYIGGGGGAAC